MTLKTVTTTLKGRGGTKRVAADAIASPVKKLRTITDEIEAEREEWLKEKAEMLLKLNVALDDRERFERKKDIAQSKLRKAEDTITQLKAKKYDLDIQLQEVKEDFYESDQRWGDLISRHALKYEAQETKIIKLENDLKTCRTYLGMLKTYMPVLNDLGSSNPAGSASDNESDDFGS